MNTDKNLFLRSHDLWQDMFKAINLYKEMIIVSPFIDGKQLSELQKIIETWDSGKNFRLKILTTTFDGQMQYLDIENLKKFLETLENRNPNIKVDLRIEDARINRKNRLHVKAYLFRNEEKSSEIIYNGSSNFTYTGMNTGEEWNIKINKSKEPNICKKIDDNFNNLWNRKNIFFDINKDKKTLEILLDYKNSIKKLQSKSNKTKDVINSVISSYPTPLGNIDRRESKMVNRLPINNKFNMKKSLFLQFAILNNKYVIENFIQIIKEGKLIDDDVINNLFIVSFIGGQLKLRTRKELDSFLIQNGYKNLKEIIFADMYSGLMEKIKKLLETLLENSGSHMINNKNLRNTFLTYLQCKALALHADYNNITNWNLSRSSGVEVSRSERGKIALFTDEESENSKYNYQDYYNVKEGNFLWYAPNSWKINGNRKINDCIMNGVKEVQIFHKTKFLKSFFKKNESKIYYEHLGVVKVETEKWIRDNQKIINFQFVNSH